MPLAQGTQTYLDNNPAVGKHVIDSRINVKKTPRLKEIFDGSCESWTYTASKGKPKLMPSDVCGDIYMSTGDPSVLTNHKFDKKFKDMYDHIREVFGYLDHETLTPEAGKKKRNAAKQELANCMRMVVQNTLGHNGFTLSANNAKTDYAVCTEYEANTDKPLYPNHTHSWLEYKGKYCFQTIPGTHLSIVQHHAGRPAHAGIVRQYVTDFLPDHISAIDDIAANPAEATKLIVNCNLRVALSTMKLTADMLSPNE
jgi:hypothetical protein